jgi:hypothetical protein
LEAKVDTYRERNKTQHKKVKEKQMYDKCDLIKNLITNLKWSFPDHEHNTWLLIILPVKAKTVT